MEQNKQLLQDAKHKMIVKYPRFAAQIASASLEYRTDLPYHTAATDGKDIFFDPEFFATLSDDEKLFLIAHELMHVKFEHMFRIMAKDGKRRDPQLWNIATDAIINANLERDGFKIKKGFVNIPDALKYTAEELYDELLEQKKEKEQNGEIQEKGGQQRNDQEGAQGKQGNDQQEDSAFGGKSMEGQFVDDHSLWDEAYEKRKGQKRKSNPSDQESSGGESNDDGHDERAEFEENREERRKRAEDHMKKLREEALKSATGKNIELGEVGDPATAVLDWKVLLKREVEKTENIWSQRRSIAENNYAYRLEENDVEDGAETEVMIDVSGSVSLDMVRGFLRQLKPILKQSKLKVGCFNELFWGMVEIKSDKDIDKFKIPEESRGKYAWTEDWDLAVRSFTKKREINKIVFTDGCPCPGTMPKEDLKGTNVIWIVYDNKYFHPCCGKVINVEPHDLQSMIKTERASKGPEL